MCLSRPEAPGPTLPGPTSYRRGGFERCEEEDGLARDYCELVEQPTSQPVDVGLARLLASVVAAGFELPPDLYEEAPELSSESAEQQALARARFASLAHVFYNEVFDPFEEPADAPVMGSLLDDLEELYSDLKRGLVIYDSGYVRGAAWDWRFHFTIHWGEHATGAVRALYWFLRHAG